MYKGMLYSIVSAIICATLTIITLRVLCTEQYTKSGVITLHINLTDALFSQPASSSLASTLQPSRLSRDPGLSEDIQGGLSSVLSAAATGIADVAEQAQAALSSDAASIQDIEEHIPHSCSLGTRQFCVTSKHLTECRTLPLNFSNLLLPDNIDRLPNLVQNVLRERDGQLSSLMGPWNKLSTHTVAGMMITETLVMICLMITSICFALGALPWLAKQLCQLRLVLRVLTTLSISIGLCTPIIALISLLYVIWQSAEKLPSWVVVDRGDVGGLSFGACACALVLALWASLVHLLNARAS